MLLKKTLFSLLIANCLLLGLAGSLMYAQNMPWDPAPVYQNPLTPYVQEELSLMLPSDRVFAYSLSYDLVKFFLNTPQSQTFMGGYGQYFAGADWVPGSPGRWYYVENDTHVFGYCDTTTGTKTMIATISGTTGIDVGLAYDPVSDTLFLLTTGPTNLYSINRLTGAATLRTAITGVSGIIDGAFSNGGQLYGIQLAANPSYLGKIDKYTGVWTNVGNLGIIPYYAQGCAFDRTDNKLYWASCMFSGPTELRVIDTTNGSSIIIGPLYDNAALDGLAIPYNPPPVSVELTSFNADINGNNVELSWSTATETNNQGFEVQRRREEKEFLTIAFVEGKGTTAETQFYYYIDEGIDDGKYQYRLKQIDFDGTFEYSQIVELEFTSPNEFALMQNYPNPFNPTTKISYSLPTAELVTLTVFDVLGKEVVTLVSEEKAEGTFEVEFNADYLPSGIYFYKLKAGNFVETKKMLLLK